MTSSVDANITEVAGQALLWKRENRESLAAALGMSTKSLGRRLVGEIPWEAAEVAIMASHFGLPVEIFFQGADALFAGIVEQRGAGMNRRYDDENTGLTEGGFVLPHPLIPSQPLALTG